VSAASGAIENQAGAPEQQRTEEQGRGKIEREAERRPPGRDAGILE
jgi:hypothetical protein